jgi:3-oxoacyl-[acyl-carrier protein] reductase
MGDIALVIGGASGIGAASARKLAEADHCVAIADLRATAATELAAQLPGSGHHGFKTDVADESALTMLFETVEREMGPIRVLVVAAGTPGYVDGKRPTLRSMTAAVWDQVMAINARGPFLCIREMLCRREVRPLRDARIVLIASMAAQVPAINSPASYVASKGALLALTRAAAGEGAGLGVTVNAVAPGAVDTPMLRNVMPVERDAAYFGSTIAGRAGTPEEIAAAVAFLASPASSYITGACIDVNGGMAMR